MIVAKFGGTATTPTNLKYLKACLTKHHGIIVVSAVGREYDGDEKVTDLLMRFYGGDDSAWAKIVDKFRRLCQVNAITIDIDEILNGAKVCAQKYDEAYCMSLGEELTARCVAAFTNRDYVEAEEYIVFSGKKFVLSETIRRLRSLGDNRVVIGGFYGGTFDGGRQTFTRGGGDISGALCAAANGATLYENFTDVDGVFVANPRCVDGANKLDGLSYAEMFLLAQNGANVLHPDAVEICRKFNVPIVVKSFWRGEGLGTIVDNCVGNVRLSGITISKNADGMFKTTIVHNLTLTEVAECIGKLARMCPDKVLKVYYKSKHIQIISKKNILKETYRAFSETDLTKTTN